MNIISKIERDNYLKILRDKLKGKTFEETSIIICPPAVHLEYFSEKIKKGNIFWGIQNAHWENSGSYTGEISPAMAKEMGADFEIIGHSERRSNFGETNDMVNKKIFSAFKNNLIPIMCIGENIDERKSGETKKVVLNQILEGLKDLTKSKVSKMIIAYEPVWSIGTGETPRGEEIMGVRILIQKILADQFGLTIKQMPKILYGGSVDYKNAREVCLSAGMDGVLVGGESLYPDSFIKIAEILEDKI